MFVIYDITNKGRLKKHRYGGNGFKQNNLEGAKEEISSFLYTLKSYNQKVDTDSYQFIIEDAKTGELKAIYKKGKLIEIEI